MAVKASNPILAGFYPDPSICAVGDDFYIVNSTFAYFPGLSVMHSKDLAHWEQIGNVMTRESQLPLNEAGSSRGLFAPTMRYHNGTYYVICTNVSYGGNFIVTSDKPEGPYSEPHYLEGADGIDPSLFFDDDGKVYYIGTHPNKDGCRYNGDYFIYIQEVDIENFKLIGEPKDVWNGAMRDVQWPEGPHLYKIGEYYYILHAEGGTGPEHAVSVARSKEVFGPYENNFCNPIFTHRHLGVRYPVKYVGHADLVQLPDGEWYMVMLAVRPIKGYTTMGRETFLARVIWEKDWPVVNPGLGILSDVLNIDLPEYKPECRPTSIPGTNKLYDFTHLDEIGPEWLFLRNPIMDHYELKQGEGLYLTCSADAVSGYGKPTYMSVRQDSHCFEAAVTLKGDNLYNGARAGICLFQSEDYNLRFEYAGCNGTVILRKGGEDEKLASRVLPQDLVTLVINVIGTKAALFMVCDNKADVLVKDLDISCLSTEVAGGFVGCTIGLYAEDDSDRDEKVKALFKSFSYKRLIPVMKKKENANDTADGGDE
ncbi:MAG: glycoside hydrolase family 43 protein [Lachnospiraceae bacterium]|nr:glycoside hydrolase family 43 protein [Lachnospiraceae bacterium]